MPQIPITIDPDEISSDIIEVIRDTIKEINNLDMSPEQKLSTFSSFIIGLDLGLDIGSNGLLSEPNFRNPVLRLIQENILNPFKTRRLSAEEAWKAILKIT